MSLFKTAILATLLAAVVVPAVSHAAAPRARKQNITVNPLGLVFGLANANYERALSKENSWVLGANFASFGTVLSRLNIMGVTGAYRWWFDNDRPMSGWFAGPEAMVESVNWSYEFSNTKYSSSGILFGGGAQGGHQWIFNSGFTLNLGLNVGYLAGSLSSVAGAPAIGFGGTYVGGNLGLGFAF